MQGTARAGPPGGTLGQGRATGWTRRTAAPDPRVGFGDDASAATDCSGLRTAACVPEMRVALRDAVQAVGRRPGPDWTRAGQTEPARLAELRGGARCTRQRRWRNPSRTRHSYHTRARRLGSVRRTRVPPATRGCTPPTWASARPGGSWPV